MIGGSVWSSSWSGKVGSLGRCLGWSLWYWGEYNWLLVLLIEDWINGWMICCLGFCVCRYKRDLLIVK